MARDRAARELVGALTALDAARHRPAARRAFAQGMARLVRAAATLSAGQHRCVVAAKPGRWGSARASKERTVDDRCRYRISYLLHAQSARRKSLCASLRAPRHPQLSREQSRSHGQRDATGQQEVVGVGTQEFGGDHHAPRGPHHDGSDEQRPSPSGVPQVRRPGTPQEPLVQPAQGCANIHVGMMPRSPIRAVVPSAAAGTVTLYAHEDKAPGACQIGDVLPEFQGLAWARPQCACCYSRRPRAIGGEQCTPTRASSTRPRTASAGLWGSPSSESGTWLYLLSFASRSGPTRAITPEAGGPSSREAPARRARGSTRTP